MCQLPIDITSPPRGNYVDGRTLLQGSQIHVAVANEK